MSKKLTSSCNDALQTNQNEIILYRPNDTISLEVRLENDTVWLTTSQMAELFNREESNIRRHIINIFNEDELEKNINVHFLHVNGVKKLVPYYTLDVVISVGFRVKSKQGILFRQWANKVLKEYLLRGYAVNQRINQLEDKIDRRFADYDSKIKSLNEQVDFFVKTSLPPAEKVFFDGQLFDAHILMSRLIESAEKRIVLIDNYNCVIF